HGERLPQTELAGEAMWLRAEAFLLGVTVAELLARLRTDAGVEHVQLEARAERGRVYLDATWRGAVVEDGTLNRWLDAPMQEIGGTATAREVLERHDSTAWGQAHPAWEGYAMLRLPLLPSERRDDRQLQLPPRPEFYDFGAAEEPAVPEALARRALADLRYVVFDTETTGLEPSRGDEIISIAGIRVDRGRIRMGESFESLVNPGRIIPEDSVRFHGINDGMVAESPRIEEVLPRFQAFVGDDTVLVAHNAAFDMRFLRLKERATGIRLNNPVLDTLLLSILAHDHTPHHTIEAIAARLGVTVSGRHTALGDAITTAEILVRLLRLLPDHGIRTLEDALRESRKTVAFRRQERAF
ncbi:MAG: 3'-5' exonuclease, partial [Ectothiorhodospiraceae bacterium]